jgi:transposase
MPPKQNVTLTDAQKYELCLYARDNKMTRAQYVNWIDNKWGIRVSESTITRILQTTDKRLATELVNPEAKRHKNVVVPELELALKEFVLNYQHKTVLSESLLIEKAKQLATGFEVPEGTLQFSAGWLQKFKKRNGIHQEKLQGEAASADETAIAEVLPMLHDTCALYPLERIYNMDETGLFYRYSTVLDFILIIFQLILSLTYMILRLEPDQTLATQRLSGRKKNRERLSIALCSNANGSHKLNPLIIGKFANPRCFKNTQISKLPMKYRNNSKAWMLATIFQEWLKDFDLQVLQKHKGQPVLLLLDNCSSHKLLGLALKCVNVHFLPPNTTSRIQPMDAGIIMAFKRHYRRFQLR